MPHRVVMETTLTCSMVLTRKKGYTLIEMMVVTLILALFAALITPNLVNIQESQARRAFSTKVVDLAGNAREMAISRHAIVYLQADTSANQIVIKQQVNDSTYTPVDGNSASTTSGSNGENPQTNIGVAANDRSSDKVQLTLPLAPGVAFGNFQLSGQASDASGWKLNFYPDGSCDGGAVELSERGVVRSLVVNSKGGASLTDGNIPDTSLDKWPAGNYVQRQL